MSVTPELHPDDLLDKEARGDLSTDELAKLDEHLIVCSVCRFERDVRGDFRAEFEDLARDGAPPAPPGRGLREETAPRTHRRFARARIFALVAAAFLVAGAAAADWPSIWRYATETPGASTATPTGVAPAAPPVTNAGRHPPRGPAHAGGAVPVDTSASVPDAEAPMFAGPATASNETTNADPKRLPVAHPAAGARSTAATPTSSATVSAPTSATPELEPPPPTALFAQAGEARQRGAYGEAIRAYEELVQRYPRSNEASNAHAILGRLLLDRGNASGALAHFDAYLAGGTGALREDAMAGRAIALQQLGRAGDEAAAWSALLASYPQSVHAARARARLAALESR